MGVNQNRQRRKTLKKNYGEAFLLLWCQKQINECSESFIVFRFPFPPVCGLLYNRLSTTQDIKKGEQCFVHLLKLSNEGRELLFQEQTKPGFQLESIYPLRRQIRHYPIIHVESFTQRSLKLLTLSYNSLSKFQRTRFISAVWILRYIILYIQGNEAQK